jgi:hypothetical protein
MERRETVTGAATVFCTGVVWTEVEAMPSAEARTVPLAATAGSPGVSTASILPTLPTISTPSPLELHLWRALLLPFISKAEAALKLIGYLASGGR